MKTGKCTRNEKHICSILLSITHTPVKILSKNSEQTIDLTSVTIFFLKMQIKLAGTICLKLKFLHLRGCINIANCPMFTSQKFNSQSGHCQALASLYVNALSSPAVCHFCLHLNPSVVINLPVCIQRCKTVF